MTARENSWPQTAAFERIGERGNQRTFTRTTDAEIADHLGSPAMQAKMPSIKAQQAARSEDYGRSEIGRPVVSRKALS